MPTFADVREEHVYRLAERFMNDPFMAGSITAEEHREIVTLMWSGAGHGELPTYMSTIERLVRLDGVATVVSETTTAAQRVTSVVDGLLNTMQCSNGAMVPIVPLGVGFHRAQEAIRYLEDAARVAAEEAERIMVEIRRDAPPPLFPLARGIMKSLPGPWGAAETE